MTAIRKSFGLNSGQCVLLCTRVCCNGKSYKNEPLLSEYIMTGKLSYKYLVFYLFLSFLLFYIAVSTPCLTEEQQLSGLLVSRTTLIQAYLLCCLHDANCQFKI